MTGAVELAGGVLVVAGGVFCVIGGIGLLRMPEDRNTRLNSSH